MDRYRVTALLTLVVAAGCLDPTGERTRRDFEETGRAVWRGVAAHLDQGVAVPWGGDGGGLRFRANAPELALALESVALEELVVPVRLDNVFAESEVSGPVADVARGEKSISFGVRVPAGGKVEIGVGRPELRAAKDFRFAWIGDVQGGYDKFASLRAAVNADPSLEFAVFAGDVTQGGGAKEIARFLEAADPLHVPWYSVLGNHETSSGNEGEFQKAIGRINVAFDYRGARFLLLDSAAATLDSRVYDFLDARLAGREPALRITAMHVPPLDFAGLRDAGFASRAEAAKLISRLADAGVDLLLAGHVHSLRFYGSGGFQVIVSGDGGVGVADRLDGTGMHYLAITARPGAGTFEASVVRVAAE